MTSIGFRGEQFVRNLLEHHGYAVEMMPPGFKTVDLVAKGADRSFRVSVKTSNKRRHVRMGPEPSICELLDSDFLFALMPKRDKEELRFSADGYDLFIIPGRDAREDGLRVHHSWLSQPKRDGTPRSGSFGVTVKGYSRSEVQRDVWGKWEAFCEAWHLLPNR